MPTYVYEVLKPDGAATGERFEVAQSMKDEPLKKHPETGAPVRRVIQGFSILGGPAAAPKPHGGGGGCGHGCGCHH